ncbi:MAG: Ni/Fe hydrogenase subunit alpha [Actinomycetota bacterium]|nr:Ni/Fe hydrogenase subunit alpha [Actinomycetota bacterium]
MTDNPTANPTGHDTESVTVGASLDAAPNRSFQVEALTRVEGEGGLIVEVHDGEVRDVRLRIFEPPRFFEAFLRGRAFTEPPDITARICGICPVAYQMSACQALEAACGVTLDEPLRDLRHLLYCGEWIESHVLHVHLLHAPDFLGYPSGIAMAADHFAEVDRGLQLKLIGNRIVEVVGGRAVHPINVKVGGFFKAPSLAAMRELAADLRQATEWADEIARWVATLPMPEHQLPPGTQLVALRHPTEYPMLGDRLVSTGGLDIAPDQYLQHFAEEHVQHSTALHGKMLSGGDYLVGPLARFVHNADHLAPRAKALAAELGLTTAERNPFRSILVRAIETLHACEVAQRIVDGYTPPARAAVPVQPRAGVGCGWSEAPRGLLWHRYELAADGTIVSAQIVPPTSQNQGAIEHDLADLIGHSLHLDDAALEALCEQAVRNYDPCISCATHFLDMRVVRT